jgi:methionyl-tRNA synthetase
MVERYFDGIIPKGARNEIDKADEADLEAYHASIGPKGFQLHEALRAVWLTVARGNEYVDRQAPWKLAKDPASRAELENTLATLMRQLMRQAVYLWPFIPGKSEELWRSLGAPESPGAVGFSGLKKLDPSGWKVAKSPPLFPKKEVDAKGVNAKNPG